MGVLQVIERFIWTEVKGPQSEATDVLRAAADLHHMAAQGAIKSSEKLKKSSSSALEVAEEALRMLGKRNEEINR